MRASPIFLLLFSLACSEARISFAPFEHVTRIDIRKSTGQVLASENDPERVAAIVQFANEELNGWETPWYGIPGPDTSADMYAGSTFLGHIGVSRGFFETQRVGKFASKPVSPAREAQ